MLVRNLAVSEDDGHLGTSVRGIGGLISHSKQRLGQTLQQSEGENIK